MPDGFTPIFSPAGTGHRAGAVPDPGTNPLTYVLSAAATWVPAANDPAHLQFGIVSGPIVAGQAALVQNVQFNPAYGTVPVIVVSTDNADVHAAASGPSGGGFDFVAMVATATVTAQGFTGSYAAFHA